MNVLVCVKRVPMTGGRISLTPDEQDIDVSYLGFTVSPHEECAVEEAVQLIEAHGGSTTVLTLGPQEAVEQLRDAMATGVDRGVLLETDGEEWDPMATAEAIVERIRAEQDAGTVFDVLLFGNEAADSGDYQVGIRVAHALGMPCVTGVKELEVKDGVAVAKREAGGGREVFRVPVPAVFTVREGINLPRYPSVPGRLKAKQKPLERVRPERRTGGPEKVRLVLPEEHRTEVEVLGNGSDAAPKVVELLRRIGVLSP
jgi:electron transfer flavoprotein beta subunit